MNFLILGDGPEEWAWARALSDHTEHRLVAAHPGFPQRPDLPGKADLDEALAVAGIEAALVGGGPELRSEGLRRVAGAGLPALCLHPPGPDADPYYQVALSRQETGAVVVPDLPARLHPAMADLREAVAGRTIGAFKGLRFEMPVEPGGGNLARTAFPRAVDVVRALVGEIDAVTATGDPPGPDPTEGLVVQMLGPDARRAEVRLWSGPGEPERLIVTGAEGSLTLEVGPGFVGPGRLVRRTASGGEPEVAELPPWDPKEAMLSAFAEAAGGREVRPDLLDGMRSLEVAGGVIRSLRRGKTIDLHYEVVSEAGNFKAVMTSVGCLLIVGTLFVLPVALAGPALGINATLLLAYGVLPVLVLFVMLQALRFAVKNPSEAAPASKPRRTPEV
jgi:predicted dehydrogenase